MSAAVANAIGLLGSLLMVIGYIYSNVARRIDLRWFNALNLIGSLLLIYSLSIAFNLASMVLEIVWGLIATFGLVKALRARARP